MLPDLSILKLLLTGSWIPLYMINMKNERPYPSLSAKCEKGIGVKDQSKITNDILFIDSTV